MQDYFDSVEIRLGDFEALAGDLCIPAFSKALVLFAHGSGSSRLSPRSQFIAQKLNRDGFATLLMDLLTANEDMIDKYTKQFRFDIYLLAKRLGQTIDWCKADRRMQLLPIGLFGASTGSAAAIIAAVDRTRHVAAIVSRGGRPDLAGSALSRLRAPILFIVGGDDQIVIDLNKEAMQKLKCNSKLEIVSGASHLFEEAGTLAAAAQLASDWFKVYLLPAADSCSRFGAVR